MVVRRIGVKAVLMGMLTLMAVSSAAAEGTFLLQLGTYGTREEADKKWQDVRTANHDVLGNLAGHVAEVMLPPDNTPTYRMQVGPVNSRKAAKALCQALEERKQECLLIESAFAASDLAPEMASETLPDKEIIVEEDEGSSSLIRPVGRVTPASEISSAPLSPIELTREHAEEKPAIASALKPTPEPAPVVAPATAVATVQEEKVAIEEKEPSPQMEEDSSSDTPEPQKTALNTEREEETSFNPNDMKRPFFFRSGNSFSSTDGRDTVEKKPVAKKEPERTTASKEDDDDKPGFFGRLFGSSSKQKERSAEKKEPSPAKPQVAQQASQPTPPLDKDVVGEVDVSEAIRVPKAQESSRYLPVADTEKSPSAPIIIPSDIAGTENLWVQISYFSASKLAQSYYAKLKDASPEVFASTRMRVNRPFGKRSARVSLRFGPFASRDTVASICADAVARNMRCTTIEAENEPAPAPVVKQQTKKHLSPFEILGMPESTATSSARRAAAPSPASYTPEKVQESTPDEGSSGGQWISLGSFQTSQDAWNYWNTLQAKKLELSNVHSSINGTLGGEGSGKVQLRAGPFASAAEAEYICKSIVSSGNICVVTTAP